jgi:hypothetical protein
MGYGARVFFGREMVGFVNEAEIGIDILVYIILLWPVMHFVICIILEHFLYILPPL